MISVEEAENLIFAHTPIYSEKKIQIQNLRSEILQENWIADLNSPPFDRVTMDGFAFSSKDWRNGVREFKIVGLQKAGELAHAINHELNQEPSCIEIMTGASLPEGTDAVLRYEDVSYNSTQIRIPDDVIVTSMLNVHVCGSDYKKGETLVYSGMRLGSVQWAIAASIGQTIVQVGKKPSVAIISTGDELVEVDQTPLAHQIRRSNVYALLAALRDFGSEKINLLHLPDQQQKMHHEFSKALEEHDVLILTGGVSMGKFDFVPQVMADLNVQQIFHKVSQRPGKPLWFGMSDNKKMVFGLPGNPVSSLVCFHRYVLPALYKASGLPESKIRSKQYAVLEQDFIFNNQLTNFPAVKIRYGEDGRTYATHLKTNTSGDFYTLLHSDGFLELSKSRDIFKAGEAVPLFKWQS